MSRPSFRPSPLESILRRRPRFVAILQVNFRATVHSGVCGKWWAVAKRSGKFRAEMQAKNKRWGHTMRFLVICENVPFDFATGTVIRLSTGVDVSNTRNISVLVRYHTGAKFVGTGSSLTVDVRAAWPFARDAAIYEFATALSSAAIVSASTTPSIIPGAVGACPAPAVDILLTAVKGAGDCGANISVGLMLSEY